MNEADEVLAGEDASEKNMLEHPMINQLVFFILDVFHFFESRFLDFQEVQTQTYNLASIANILYGALLLLFGRYFIISFAIVEILRQMGSASFVHHIQKMITKRKAKKVINAQALLTKASQISLAVLSVVQLKFFQKCGLGLALGDDLYRLTVSSRFGATNFDANRWHGFTSLLGVVLAFVFRKTIRIVSTSFRGTKIIGQVLQDDFSLLGEPQQFELFLATTTLLGIVFQSIVFPLYYENTTSVRVLFFPAVVYEDAKGEVKSWLYALLFEE